MGSMCGPCARLVLVAGATLLAAADAAAAQDLVLANGRFVDPSSASVIEGSMLIRDGRVAEVAPNLEAPAGVEILDLGGRWVIPGLFDLHTHSFGNGSPGGAPEALGPEGTAKVALYAGVVGYLDLFSPEDMVLGVRDRQRAGELAGADIFAAGPCLTATDGHCSEYGVPTRLVDSPEDARREIAELAPKRPDVIKLVYDNATYGEMSMPTVDRPTMEAVVEAAHAHGLKAVIHIGTWQDVEDAVRAGADAVTHTPPGAPPAHLPALMVERGTLHIPTLGVQSELSRIADDPTVVDRPLLTEVASASLLDAYRDVQAWPAGITGFLGWVRSQRETNREAVAALFAAGVTMATGTDAGNPGVFQGYSVHREMELMVAAGLTPLDALQAATSNPAAFIGKDWGVHVGAEASLVVLEASPLDDITNTQRIHAVVQRGRVVDRAALR